VRTRTVRVGVPAWRAVLAGLVAGTMAAAGFLAAAVWLARGVVVATSNPPGAQVIVDGRPAPDPTPTVVEGLRLSQPHTVEIRAADRRPVAVELEPRPGELVRRVHGDLPTLLSAITVESDPPGAEVRLDGRAVGSTPLTVPGVRIDERHRIDLALPGHEFDQFVVLPEKDGLRFQRKLAARRGPRGGRPE
jgi:hypothetical protein